MLERRPAVGRRVRAESPRAADVVLEPGAADRRELGVAVAEDLDLAFAVPGARVDDAYADAAAEEAARAAEVVGDHEVAAHDGRVLAPERHVQDTELGRQLRLQRVVDLEVEHRAPRTAVDDFDAHLPAERHRHVGVEAAAFLRGRQRRRVRDRSPVRQHEEVEARHGDARLGLRRRRTLRGRGRASARAVRAGTSSRCGG